MLKFLICLLVVFYISKILNFTINLWQEMPLEEEKRSHPLYITKELKF